MNEQQSAVKNYLSKAYQVELRIDDRVAMIQSLRDLAVKAGPTASDMPGSPNRNIRRMEDIIVKITDQENGLRDEIDRLLDLRKSIHDLIAQVDVPEQQVVLEQRYLRYLGWDEISGNIGVCRRQVYRIHDAGLEKIKIPESCHEML